MKQFKSITSKENSLIKLISELNKNPKKRTELRLFVLEGLRICKDAFENRIEFDKLIVSESALTKYNTVILLFSESSSECVVLPDVLFKKISQTDTPQGIIVTAKIPDNSFNINKDGRYIALENIQDPANLGAISRTCEALGASGLIITKNSCDPYSSKSLRASMGTLLRIPVFFSENLILDLKRFGLKTYACVVDKDAISVKDVKFENGCALLIGNEANGLSDETKNNSDYKITIPMKGKAESLNAAAAAAISTWEMMK